MATKVASWTGSIASTMMVSWASADYDALAQTFSISGSYDIEYVTLWMRKTSNPGTTLTVAIYSDGPGSSLGSKTVDISGWSETASRHTITFDTPISVTTENYNIVLTEASDRSTAWGHSGAGIGSGALHHHISTDDWGSPFTPVRTFDFEVWASESVPSKPITPTPANAATEVDFSEFTLSWENGGGATSYDVYIGPSGSLVEVSTGQVGTSYITNMDEVPYNQVIYWRVDAVNDTGTTEGDTWNFDARPGAAITPYPADDADGITLNDTTATWESGSANTTSFDVYFRPFGEFYELVGPDTTDLFCTLYETNYHYGQLYFWSVVAKNDFGTYPENAPDGSISDYEWYFNAMVFTPPLPTGVTLVDGVPTGTPTGANNIITVKRLVAVALNKVWYEDI